MKKHKFINQIRKIIHVHRDRIKQINVLKRHWRTHPKWSLKYINDLHENQSEWMSLELRNTKGKVMAIAWTGFNMKTYITYYGIIL